MSSQSHSETGGVFLCETKTDVSPLPLTADSKNVMQTRSGLTIRTVPASSRSGSSRQPSRSSSGHSDLSPTDPCKTPSLPLSADRPMSQMSFVTRFMLIRQGNLMEMTGECSRQDRMSPEVGVMGLSLQEEWHKEDTWPVHTKRLIEPLSSGCSPSVPSDTSANPLNLPKSRPVLQERNIINSLSIPASRILASLPALEPHRSPPSEQNESKSPAPSKQPDVGGMPSAKHRYRTLQEAKEVASAAETLVAMATSLPNQNKATEATPEEKGAQGDGSQNDMADEIVKRIVNQPGVVSIIQHPRDALSQSPAFQTVPLQTIVSKDFLDSQHGDGAHTVTDKAMYSKDLERFGSECHVVTFDASGNQIHKCGLCSKVFTIMAAFHSHVQTHFKQKNKCSVCGKLFSRSWLLKGHMRTHTGERPYRCSFPGCHKAFADKSNLRSHNHIHTAEGKNFVCSKCHRAFAQKRYLHKHLLEVCKL